MRTWSGIFRRIDLLDPADRRLAAERADFERWAAAAENRVMDGLLATVEARSRETRARTGAAVSVSAQSNAEYLGARGGARRVISLTFARSGVDLFSARSEGESPRIHFVCQRAPTSSRFPVVLSLPGCLVVRTGSGHRLLGFPELSQTTLDALVLRAFDLLFGAFQSVHTARPASCATEP